MSLEQLDLFSDPDARRKLNLKLERLNKTVLVPNDEGEKKGHTKHIAKARQKKKELGIVQAGTEAKEEHKPLIQRIGKMSRDGLSEAEIVAQLSPNYEPPAPKIIETKKIVHKETMVPISVPYMVKIEYPVPYLIEVEKEKIVEVQAELSNELKKTEKILNSRGFKSWLLKKLI